MRVLEALKRGSLPGPKPAGGEGFYTAQRIRRFAVSPAAEANWNRYQQWLVDDSTILDAAILPSKAVLSPNSQCNFKCTMCAVSDFPRGKRAEPMTADDFIRRLDECPTLVEISTGALSEILMCDQDDLLRMLTNAKSRELWIHMVTNASLAHQKNWSAKLAELGPHELTVSLDGTSKSVFEKIRRGSNYERVIRNTQLLVKAFEQTGIANRIKVQVTLQKANTHELHEFVPFIESLGVRSIAFSVDIFGWGDEDWTQKNALEKAVLEPDALSSVVDDASKRGISVGFVSITGRFNAQGPKSERCKWPFASTFVSSEGRFVPCCHISNPDYFEIQHGLGNDAATEDVWHSDVYERFRQDHLDGNIPVVCKPCYLNGGEPVEVPVNLTSKRAN